MIIKNLIIKFETWPLDSKIDDLLSGKVVNHTENQAAFHPKYRKNKGFINEFIKSDTDFAPQRKLKD